MESKIITVYHFDKIWTYKKYKAKIQFTIGSSIDKGYMQSNNANVWIFYKENANLDANNFCIGDIILNGDGRTIKSQSDLKGNYFNITSISDKNYGTEKSNHIRIIAN